MIAVLTIVALVAVCVAMCSIMVYLAGDVLDNEIGGWVFSGALIIFMVCVTAIAIHETVEKAGWL